MRGLARRDGDAKAGPLSLYGWIWRHSRRSQLAILALILASMPFYFLALDLPRRIVNGPIQGQGFESGRAEFFALPPWLAVAPLDMIWPAQGVSLSRGPALLALCGLLFLLILINGGFKYAINLSKGRLGERMLRRLRFSLFERVLAFPPQRTRSFKGAEIASMIKDEVESLGGFVGEAIVTPVFLGGQALTAAAFIMTQNAWLGLIALATVAVQGLVIPRLRRRLVLLGRDRQRASRLMAGRIAETVEGIGDVHVHRAGDFERAELAGRLGGIFAIRFELFRRKFLIKFLNNSLAQLPPLLFFLLGGLFVFEGRLDIGQLLAVLVAYKDLPGPIAELIDWDQTRQDAEIKFEQVMETFAPVPAQRIAREFVPAPSGTYRLEVSGLAVDGAGIAEPLRDAAFRLDAGERVAVIAVGKAGAVTVAQAIAGLVEPAGGLIRHHVRGEAGTAPRIGYAGEDPFLARGSLRAALLYGLREKPAAAAGQETRAARRLAREAAASGTPFWPSPETWLDTARLGAAEPEAVDARLTAMLAIVGLEERLLALALERHCPAAAEATLGPALLAARRHFRAALGGSALGTLVEPFEPDRYNHEASIHDNLVFGHVRDGTVPTEDRAAGALRLALAAAPGLGVRLLALGIGMARAAVDLYGDLAAESRFVVRQRLVPPEQLPLLGAVLSRRAEKADTAEDRDVLLRLALGYREPLHRLGLLTAGLRARILAARRRLRRKHGTVPAGAIEFLDPARLSAALSIEENVSFGVVVQSRADGPRRIRAAIRAALSAAGALERVLALGLDHDVGNGGRALGLAERQQVALARALLGRPDLLIADRALSALAPAEQRRVIAQVLGHLEREVPGTAAFWVLADAGAAPLFARRLTFRDGVLEAEDEGGATPGWHRPATGGELGQARSGAA